jgi:hypothetical protein
MLVQLAKHAIFVPESLLFVCSLTKRYYIGGVRIIAISICHSSVLFHFKIATSHT